MSNDYGLKWNPNMDHGLVKSVSIGTTTPAGRYCSVCDTLYKDPSIKKCTAKTRYQLISNKLLMKYPKMTLAGIQRIQEETQWLNGDQYEHSFGEASYQEASYYFETKNDMKRLFSDEEEREVYDNFFSDLWGGCYEIDTFYDKVICDGEIRNKEKRYDAWDSWSGEMLNLWKQ